MESLVARQSEIIASINSIKINFSKDPASRKSADYIQKRLDTLDNLWGEFEQNHSDISGSQCEQYFLDNTYQRGKDLYQSVRKIIASYGKSEKSTQPDGKLDELIALQRTNFRAFNRLIKGINVNAISDKWELEDELRSVQAKWNIIDTLQLQIDHILVGGDISYEEELNHYETAYKNIKRELHKKISSSVHIQQSVPQLEIPTFSGNYTQWPTFYDLFNESIHSNNSITKSQKMQHLKGKLRGEAERLIQHLHISSENYDTAWDILLRRYDNPQVLFSKQIEMFLNQPIIQRQTAYELKRLYDTSTECINAIHNLGVDTNTWDPLLVHLLCKKLDSVTYSDYKEARKSPRDLPALDELMAFLENKFTALEPIHSREKESSTAIRRVQPLPQKAYNKFSNHRTFENNSKNYLAVATIRKTCLLCNCYHDLYQCKRFLNMTPDNQMRTVTKLKICQNCLYKHYDNVCVSTKRCKNCNGEHNTILHDAANQSTSSTMLQSNSVPQQLASTTAKHAPFNLPNKQNTANRSVNFIADNDEEIILSTVLLKIKSSDGTYVTIRALLDQCAQVTLLNENVAQMLGLQRRRFNASVSGAGIGSRQGKGVVFLDCQSIYDDFQFTTEALVVSKVTDYLPTTSLSNKSWRHLQHLKLADPEYNVSRPVDLILDSGLYSDLIREGLVKGPPQAPIAQKTAIGWIVSGNTKTFSCHVVVNQLTDLSKYWEIEDVGESSSSTLTNEEQYCEEFYQQTTRRLDTGRFEVGLPMKPDFQQNLGLSKSKAIAQFRQLEYKMSKNQSFTQSYKSFMCEYQQEGHMKNADNVNEPTRASCYLPHHGVLKSDSTTTKLRVVFNASAKTSSGQSLNDLMFCGSNLQNDLLMLILNWRKYKYVITADIEKMFRQILIRESDQSLQSIIWRESPQDLLREYHLTTVTYGTKAAPYLAMRTLKQLAIDDAEKYPLAASAIQTNFYMDDLLSGHNSIAQAKELQYQLIEMLKGAGMNIRKWSSNEPELLEDLSTDQLNSPFDFKCYESRKTLGLRWNPSTDSFTFQFQIGEQDKNHRVTKRQLLSEISKLFDPLGWLSPLSIRAKLLFQNAWSSKATWDDELPQDIQQDWIRLKEDLKIINEVIIPRHLGNIDETYQIHAFCDASDKAYACTIYVVTKNNKGEYTSRLAVAKTKLAPLAKKVSLPRLELCGALLLSQLMKKVKDSLSNQNVEIYAWTDSMIVLGWIHGDVMKWKQFVANRVKQITDIIPSSHWHHVKSEENAADCATRGGSTKKLSEYQSWWEGPQWIKNFDQKSLSRTIYETPDLESKIFCVNAALHENHYSIIHELLQKHSSLTRVVHIVAWVSRFIACTRGNHTTIHTDKLTSSEVTNAYNIIVRGIQLRNFKDDIYNLKHRGHVHSSSSISSLNPFIDDHGLLRVGGRLRNACISESAKHPIILPSHGRLTELIIDQAHMTTLHGGPRLTLSIIRDNYWIICGVRTVKRHLRTCVQCRRYNHTTQQQIMADLPEPRVTPSRPFTHTGVDFTGHVELKANKGRGIKTTKGYIAVFVCLSTKAVHLELVSDLSTPAFLAAFRRFSARRGTPSHVYSDNGSNFIGANRIIKKEYQEIVASINADFFSNINDMCVAWHFNAPAWPSAGGLWEAAVKSLKYHLKRIIGEQKLTYEEFCTLLHQIEACLNSRPLCQLTESPDDDFLTPGHFLVGGPLLSRPQAEPHHINSSTRWQLIQAMNKQFWKRWSSEYLQQLQARSKWRTPSRNIETNDVVLVKEENLPPGKWAMGRVQEVHPGRDGYVRVATLKTSSNIIKRPVSKLVLLPVKEETPLDENNQQSIPKVSARSRRTPKASFSSYICAALLMLCMLLSPTMQQEMKSFNITQLNDDQGLYFDKMFDLQIIRDEWKLIIYYNMSTYWQGISAIKNYVTHIKQLSDSSNKHLSNIVLQLEHELDEIDHYNNILRNQYPKRQKRGLINGIGYVANSLFGILDERFAEQYHEDIEKIARNENHLLSLFKNQTSILEAEYNILRRNEQYMNHQFTFIKDYLTNITSEVQWVRTSMQNDIHITASALSANIILSNLRRIQQTLIDTVTNIAQGRIDPHLLSPDQLSYQISIILNQLHGDLTLPVGKSDIKDLYQLLKVSARIMNNYLIVEIKIPLLSNEIYELDRIITLQQKRGKSNYLVLPFTPYISFNLRNDMVILLTDNDLQSCVHISTEKLLCSLDKPIYSLQLQQSLCDIKFTSSADISPCKTKQSPCNDLWIKLRRQNVWLFSCCEKCHVRIMCTADIKPIVLQGNGVFDIGQGCILKGDTFTIHAHNNYLNHMNVQPNVQIPEISILNSVVNTSLPISFKLEDHEQKWEQLGAQIATIKEQSALDRISSHDIHHYTVLYAVIAFILVVGGIFILFKNRKRYQKEQVEPPMELQRVNGVSLESVSEMCESKSVQGVSSEVRKSTHSVNIGTSPMPLRSRLT